MQIIICVEKVSTACDIFAAQISGTFQRNIFLKNTVVDVEGGSYK
ncbi:hypothetical protein DsansV1_C32g0222521 [Dioscorea sansibarensis]